MFYDLIKHGFSTYQSARRDQSKFRYYIYQIPVVFYHSVIHVLGLLFVKYKIIIFIEIAYHKIATKQLSSCYKHFNLVDFYIAPLSQFSCYKILCLNELWGIHRQFFIELSLIWICLFSSQFSI